MDDKLRDVLLHLGFECVEKSDVRKTKYIKKVEDIGIDDYEGVEQFYTFLFFGKTDGYFLWDFNNNLLNIDELKDLKSIYVALNKEFPYIMRKYKINQLLNI